jgi:hypothetical protein
MTNRVYRTVDLREPLAEDLADCEAASCTGSVRLPTAGWRTLAHR